MKSGRYVWNGKTWVLASECQKQPAAGAVGAAGYPYFSEALAVHPVQTAQEAEDYRRCGVPTEFNKMGQPKIESRAHFKQVLKINGMHERSKVLSGRPCA